MSTISLEDTQTLAELRRSALRWERNLAKNRDHYWAEGRKESGIKCEQQLSIVEEVLDIIGRA